MKRILLSAIGLIATAQLSAQHQLDLSVNAGIGKIALISSPMNDLTGTRVADFSSPTYALNAHYSYSFGDFSIESGIRFNQVKGKHTEGINFTEIELDGSFRTIEKDYTSLRKTSYLSIPLTFNYKIENLTIGAGVYAGYLIRSEHTLLEYTNGELAGFQSVSNMSKLDFGLTAHADFALSDRASIIISTNYGLADISNGKELGASYYFSQFNPVQRDLKIRQVLVGLKFRLHKS